MVKSRFHTQECRLFGTRLYLAGTPHDLAIIQSLLSKDLYKISAIVSLPVYETDRVFGPVVFPDFLFRNYFVPYFHFPYIYVIHHDIISPAILKIDYSVTFDTNFASYVKAIVRTGSLEGQQEEVKKAMDEILYNNVNFVQ